MRVAADVKTIVRCCLSLAMEALVLVQCRILLETAPEDDQGRKTLQTAIPDMRIANKLPTRIYVPGSSSDEPPLCMLASQPVFLRAATPVGCLSLTCSSRLHLIGGLRHSHHTMPTLDGKTGIVVPHHRIQCPTRNPIIPEIPPWSQLRAKALPSHMPALHCSTIVLIHSITATTMRATACSLCVLYLGVDLLVRAVEGAEFKRRDGVHRLEKAHVTVFHDLNRRGTTTCATGYSACPSSLDGGCCASGYACATDSCYATTSAAQTCAGKPGYYQCNTVLGGGCCPEGYQCQRGSNCVPASGVIYSQSCPASYYLCPASLSYGCCRDGLGCAVSACYSTEPSTVTETTTITTTNDAAQAITTTVTATAVLTPSRPTTAPIVATGASDPDQVVFKYYPSTVPKEQPISSGDGNSDGLTSGQIAGIVAGGVGLLIIVLVTAWIIIRHLNKVVQAVETSNKGTSSGAKSRPSMYEFKPTPSEVDDLSIDPLMMSPRPSHRRYDSDTTADFTPPYRGTPGSGGDYQAVPQGSGSDRHASYDSAYTGGYFDVAPDRSQRASQGSSAWVGLHRGSTDSQGTYAHLRHWSNASEASSDHGSAGTRTPLQELDSTPYVPELAASPVPDAVADTRRRSGSGLSGMSRPPAVHQRRRSSEGGHGRTKSDSSAPAGLSVVNEASELIGHYGPTDRANGQTSNGK
ncbi:hypothetical protein CABS01_05531 [Colletotrichum abscissum]|nr:uncharacterized protein CABS01_05531 [Colletotrichum abscissum]KAK1521026.1 hypothetical protein CABS01_05531 [Colletotrichum abscissum]